MRILEIKGGSVLLDDEDFEEMSKYSWCVTSGYAVRASRTPDGRKTTVRMHRQLLGIEGRVDHEDRNRLNNQRGNLRPATAAQNARNQGLRDDNTSGAKGVYFETRNALWVGQVYAGKQHRIRHKSREVVEVWVRNKRIELHGEYACDGEK